MSTRRGILAGALITGLSTVAGANTSQAREGGKISLTDVRTGYATQREYLDQLKKSDPAIAMAIKNGVIEDLYIYPRERFEINDHFTRLAQAAGYSDSDSVERVVGDLFGPLGSTIYQVHFVVVTIPSIFVGRQIPHSVVVMPSAWNGNDPIVGYDREFAATIGDHELVHAYDFFDGVSIPGFPKITYDQFLSGSIEKPIWSDLIELRAYHHQISRYLNGRDCPYEYANQVVTRYGGLRSTFEMIAKLYNGEITMDDAFDYFRTKMSDIQRDRFEATQTNRTSRTKDLIVAQSANLGDIDFREVRPRIYDVRLTDGAPSITIPR